MKLKILLILFTSIVFIGKIQACKCMGTTVDENIKTSDAVFSGKIISKVTTTNFDSLNITLKKSKQGVDFSNMPITAVAIKVDKFFKGAVKSDTVMVITSAHSASCGVYFQVGQKFIVYATRNMRSPYKAKRKHKNIFWTHSCTRTNSWSSDEEKAIVRVLKK